MRRKGSIRRSWRSAPLGWILAAVAVVSLDAGSAAAEDSATLNRFRPSETTADDFQLSRPVGLPHLGVSAQLHVDYAHDPLVFEERLGDLDTELTSIVSDQVNGTLGIAIGLSSRWVIYAGLPVVLSMSGDDTEDLLQPFPEADGAGLGDVYLGARLRLVGDEQDSFAAALQVTGTLPTSGDDQSYRGDSSFSLHPELLVSVRPTTSLRLVANAGARFREDIAFEDTNYQRGDELTFGLGAALSVWNSEEQPGSHLDLHAQGYAATDFDEFFGREETALEAIGGLKYHHAAGAVAGVAAGPGLNRGVGTPDLRVIAMLGYGQPEERDADKDGLIDKLDACPAQPEDKDAFEDSDGCPDPDNDRDGILDVSDRCPMEPETVNQVDDTDGCPDEVGDTDGDGLIDTQDQCAQEPEDKDGFQDEDGCPDVDNDGDRILDVDDKCINTPGVLIAQGCPEPDRDKDTVIDRLDNCPDEPGTVENQGCKEAQQVRIGEGTLEILELVYFRTNSSIILSKSFPLLENVASVLNSHPEILKIVVEGHTDARGRHASNVKLSQGRAESVVQFLVRQGKVDASRLTSKGYGPDRPVIADATTKEEHARNRRVEFKIPKTEGIQQQDKGPDAATIDR